MKQGELSKTQVTMNTPLPYASRHLGNPSFRDVMTLGSFRSPVRNLDSVDAERNRGITHWRAFYAHANSLFSEYHPVFSEGLPYPLVIRI